MKTTGQQANRPLPLDGAWNVRELGGYRTKDGRITRTGVFFRADGTSGLSRRDVEDVYKRQAFRGAAGQPAALP